MVGITVSTVIRASYEHVVEIGPSSDYQVKLMPVMRSWVTPGGSVLGLGGEKGVCDAEVVVCTQFEKTLSIFILFANSKMSNAAWP